MRQVHTVKYRKWKSPNSAASRTRRAYVGRVHLQFYSKIYAHWIFVCSKPNELDMGGPRGEVTDDFEVVTCMRCRKHAPEVVEIMDDIPSLDDFQ